MILQREQLAKESKTESHMRFYGYLYSHKWKGEVFRYIYVFFFMLQSFFFAMDTYFFQFYNITVLYFSTVSLFYIAIVFYILHWIAFLKRALKFKYYTHYCKYTSESMIYKIKRILWKSLVSLIFDFVQLCFCHFWFYVSSVS